MFKKLLINIKKIPWSKINGDAAATLSMRWARPIFFILMTVMLIAGWYYPATLDLFFTALAKAPEWLTNIFTILILGLAVEKSVARPLVNALKKSDG